MPARSGMRLLCILAILLMAGRSFAALDLDGERIMEVLLEDGSQLSAALVMYPSAQDWYFPLGETTESLGLAIKVSAALAKASGFVIEERRQFELDVARCRVRWNGNEESYPCDKVQVHQDDIFVQQDLFQRWFPVKFQLNLFKSQVIVVPVEKLPVQLRREREHLAERSKGLNSEFDPGYPIEPVPAKAFSPPIVDDQLSLGVIRSGGSSAFNLNNTVQATGELLGLEAYALLSHNDHEIQTSRFTLSKRSPDGSLFGPLQARDVSAFSITTPLMPLVTSGVAGRGFMVSSFPINQPFTFDKHDFQGPLPSGWEVLLYRNEVLVDRQVSDGSGIYFFRNVTLFYGLNRFRLTFFGPYGQRRDEYRTINLSPDLIQPGKGYYRFSYLQLPDTSQRATAQFSQNFSRHITGSASVMHDSAGRNYGTVGLAGMNERFLFSTICAFNDRNGKACEWSTQFGVEWLTATAKYTRLFDFQSELFNRSLSSPQETGETAINVAYLLPVMPMVSITLEGLRRSFRDSVDTNSLRNFIAFTSGKFYWNNRLEIQEAGGANQITGRWDLSYVPSLTRFNLGLDYQPTRLLAASLEMQANFDNRYLINALVNRRLREATTLAQVTASRYFGSYALGATFSTTDFRDFSAGLLLTIGLLTDPTDLTVKPYYRPVGQYGAASLRVFKDINHNNHQDPGEPGVSDVQVIVNQREIEQRSDENGKILLTYLQPYQPTDIGVSITSLKDPFLKSGKKGIRFVPRAGKVAALELPLQVVGSVDGNVDAIVNGVKRGRRGIEIELRATKGDWKATVKSDRDGFYQFDDVPPGTYTLHVLGERSVPAELKVTMPAEGSFESGNNFELQP